MALFYEVNNFVKSLKINDLGLDRIGRNTITFETDKFSLYVFVYKNEIHVHIDDDKNGKCDICGTDVGETDVDANKSGNASDEENRNNDASVDYDTNATITIEDRKYTSPKTGDSAYTWFLLSLLCGLGTILSRKRSNK